jgi:ABC-type glycerol-3-phosphate transport system substrate-binding protein
LREKIGKAPQIVYVQRSPATFETDFINALASGRGPDLILLPQDLILKHQDKIVPIPYSSYPERTFKDTFIEEGELYLTPNGILGIPFSIDPIIMYWNRSLFSSAAIATPPKFWDEFPALVEKLTTKDNALNISQSAVALGEYSNVSNAKEILSTLMFQAGNPIVQRVQGNYESLLGSQLDKTVAPAEAAVSFFTQFSNPSLAVYSWNRSLPTSRDAFVSEDLATYFGFASELPILRAKNPNLNFDVAPLPQARGDNRVTYGSMQAMAIVRNSKYVQDAYNTAILLTGPQYLPFWTQVSGLPPVRRDLLSVKNINAVSTVMYNSALWSKGWYDPDKNATALIFQNLIESISTGRARPTSAVGRAQLELDRMFRR